MILSDGTEYQSDRPEPGFMSTKKPFTWTTIENGEEVLWENVKVVANTAGRMFWRRKSGK